MAVRALDCPLRGPGSRQRWHLSGGVIRMNSLHTAIAEWLDASVEGEVVFA